MKKKDVFVVGSHIGQGAFIRCSQLPKPGESVEGWGYDCAVSDDGGKGSNQALCAARLGASVTFFCALGNKDGGWASLASLSEAGVDLTPVLKLAGVGTGAGIVIVDAQGFSMIVTDAGANAAITSDDIINLKQQMRQHACMLTQFELKAEIASQAARLAAEVGARAFVTPGPLPKLKPDALRDIDILVPNETEAATLLGSQTLGNDCHGAVHALRDQWGVRNVILTRGGDGVTALWQDEVLSIPAFRVTARNTVGAGDGFCAALSLAIARDIPIKKALIFACAVAAFSVQVDAGPWSSYPDKAQLAQFMTERGCSEVCEHIFRKQC